MRSAAFTGTRAGLTLAQKERLRVTFKKLKIELLRHGDCIGADEQIHEIAQEMGIETELHPCTLTSQRANCTNAKLVYDPLPPLERNHLMVDIEDLLIATPKSINEELRSGTWATIRYARKLKKRVIIVWPGGAISDERRAGR